MSDQGVQVDLRMRLTCIITRADPSTKKSNTEQFEVLNEPVIDRGPSPFVSNIEIHGDD